ncbi:calcineurin-like phosphoesterase [Penicillium hispanicum]|uniref:calcineurin-like phosphoesterase n=1 Tax=Penicillium hispanicum TaxID=1080232 RepID=UPI0025406566|nr:calcineurin-like phosphoesterase [Penicillium hispanicum]KAJ5579866.1 calcineurin-like phosphoesterase [Penicillium hispanicum]
MLQSIRSLFRSPSASFQILSDLHLEINQQYSLLEVPICSKHLILAGDIGRLQDYGQYLAFLRKQTDHFEIVFLVLGNHEFYNESFESGLEKARQLEQEPCLNGRLVLLHRRRYDVPGTRVTILGCTLWSNIPSEARDIVQSKIQDYRKIQGWAIDQHNAAHQSDLTWLRHEIQMIHQDDSNALRKMSSRSIVVVTHHAPSLQRTSIPQHAQNPWSVAFGTDLISEKWEGVKLWVFGHTHYTTEFKERGLRVVSNQRGYVLPWSKETEFDARKTVWV